MTEVFKSLNLDANESMFFARELERIKTATYDIQYPGLRAMQLLPVSTDAGAGAEVITYYQYDYVGSAQFISDYSQDLPRAEVKGKQFSSYVKSIGLSYAYTVQEIQAAQMAGKPLSQRKAIAARDTYERFVDQLAWFGNKAEGLMGFLNNPNLPKADVENDGSAGATAWAAKTPDQILRDMFKAVNGVVETTKGIERPNTMLLPLAQYNYIASTPRSASSDTTILQYFQENMPGVTVERVNEMKGAGTSGADLMVVYDRNPQKLTLEIPMAFRQYPVQERGLEMIIPCMGRFGGCVIYYPMSVSLQSGI